MILSWFLHGRIQSFESVTVPIMYRKYESKSQRVMVDDIVSFIERIKSNKSRYQKYYRRTVIKIQGTHNRNYFYLTLAFLKQQIKESLLWSLYGFQYLYVYSLLFNIKALVATIYNHLHAIV